MKESIEQMIDKHGLASVLEAISDICLEKSDHILACYSDVALSAVWNRDGVRIKKLSEVLTH